MRSLLILALTSFFLISCGKEEIPPEPDGFIRVNATLQEFSEGQPWDRKPSVQRRGLGALLPNKQILTTSEMVAKQVYLELESADGSETITAKVVAIDRDANLALLEPENKDEESFLDELKALELSPALKIGDKVETWQLENNGQTTVTKTNIYAVDVVNTHSGGKRFFSYLLKGSLQSASNSYTVPILSKGTLAGILTSYDSEDQISEVITSPIIEQFLEDASDGDYIGFPSLGVAATKMLDKTFRDWLGLEPNEGGLYLTRVAKNSAAGEAELQVGDVLLSLDGHGLDLKGYYDDAEYGKLSWTHLIRGSKEIGDSLSVKIKRDGEIIEKKVTLRAPAPLLIPNEFPPTGPQYFIKGGVIFQQLTKRYLQAYGKDWTSRAPLNLLDVYYQPENYEDQFEEAVIITGIIPSQNTVGYESVRNSLIKKVNGVDIKKISDLETGFENPEDDIHHIELSEAPYEIYLNAEACKQVDQALVDQGLPALKRFTPSEEAPVEEEQETDQGK